MNTPSDGYVADIMRRTRPLHNYTIRKLKNNAELLRKSAKARAINDNNSRKLWTEVYKIKNKNSTISNSIDDVSGDVDIANLISNKHSVLYNSVAFEKSALDNLLESTENDVVQHCVNKDDPVLFTHTHHITVEQVKYAIHKLKPGKTDCIDGIVSDNFKNGADLL